MTTLTLNNNVKIPQLGYGVFKIPNDECERCVLDALAAGYRLIDTAQIYLNEEGVGNALAKTDVKREDIFLTTKIWVSNYGYEEAKASVYESLRKLKTDYLDLCLLHQPYFDVYGAYRTMEDLYDAGVIRAIGVSNFYADRMVDIASFTRIKPAVNQVEIHPFYQRETLKEWHDKYGIALEAWAPLGQIQNGIMENPILVSLAEKYGKTAAQVILRWHIQRGIIVIPKTTHIERMRENIDVFDFALTADDLAAIAALDTGKSNGMLHTDPKAVERYVEIARDYDRNRK